MSAQAVSWRRFGANFARLGLLGFGGPPAHMLMMRRQWVDTGVLEVAEFNDAFAAVSLLPGPASTQMSLWIGWRLRGWRGLLAAAALFITPAVVMVLVLSYLVLGDGHPRWINAAALGAAAVVPAIAVRAAYDIARGYRWRESTGRTARIVVYLSLGAVVCLVAPYLLPLAMILAGLGELAVEGRPAMAVVGAGATKAALAWTALKVGALSFGGGFVIVPIMRGDAVTTHHWMTAAAFATAVAIGQLTPGPVVATVAAVGFAAAGWAGGVEASVIAFAPSLVFVALGARHLHQFRQRHGPQAFLVGAGPTATGAIAASAVTLAHGCVLHWQWPILVLAFVPVVVMRRSTTAWLLAGTATGLLIGLATNLPV
jgi:chromate transporter